MTVLLREIYFRTKWAGDVRATPCIRPNRGVFGFPKPDDIIHGVDIKTKDNTTQVQASRALTEILPLVVGKTYDQWLRLPNYVSL